MPSACIWWPGAYRVLGMRWRPRCCVSSCRPCCPTIWCRPSSTQLVLLERLPLTANGKLDKRALPAPGAPRQQFVAPQGIVEQTLAAIWCEVLKLEQVGSTDNFFELGGDSILSLQIIARAKRQGLKLSPKQLFEKQTIGQLAAVAKIIEKKTAQPVVEQVTGHLPLLPIQARFFDTDIIQRGHWNQALMLQPVQPLRAEWLRTALHALVMQHDALRLRFVQGEAWQAEFHSAVDPDLLWTRQLDDPDTLTELADSAQRSLDLSHGPLLRAVLVTLPDATQRVLLVIHHLVVDGVSWRVLLEDLQQAYRAVASGQAVNLPAKSSSLKAWADRLGLYAQSPALQAEAEYWLACLEAPVSPLPLDDANAARTQREVAHATSRLDAQQTRALLQVAPAAYHTQVNDLLLTALAQVLCEWTDSPSVLIQLEGHGAWSRRPVRRTRPEPNRWLVQQPVPGAPDARQRRARRRPVRHQGAIAWRAEQGHRLRHPALPG